MKRKLLLAALCVVGALGFKANAQTDVTSTYITSNADFSSVDGWSLSASTQYHDQGVGLIGAYAVANNKTSTTDATHLATEYCMGFQCRWSTNFTNYTQTKASADLPVGNYTITYDVQNTNTSTTSASYNNLFYVQVGATTYNDAQTEWMSGSTGWTTHTINFTLEEATTADFTISLGYGTGSNNYGSGNTPHLYVSHLKVFYAPIIRPTAVSISSSLALTVGGTSTLTPTYTPADANTDTDITWVSSDPTVASVAGGVVTAVGPGTATITATTANSLTSTCSVTVTDVTPAAAPASYSEIADGDFYIVNAATGKYLGGANSWGSQASLIEHGIPFTVALNDGKYTLDSRTFESNVKHFFSGTYVDAASTSLYITSLGSGKYSISTADGAAFVTANVNDNVVANTAATANSVLAQWYFVSKANLESTFANATNANPVDATFYIGDPNFSRNYILKVLQNGKTTDNPGSQTYPWTYTVTNYNFKGGENDNMCAESYHSAGTISQTLTVPNGKYLVKCQGFRRQDSGSDESYLYANDEKVALQTFNGNGEGTAASMTGASASFSAGLYNNSLTVYVTDGQLTIGIQGAANNWTIFDNFELYYCGPTVGGEATGFELATETALTADKWYSFEIPVDGMYNLTTTTLSDIVYTNDATILIENEGDVTDKFSKAENETLTAGTYYVKSASAQTLEVTVGAYAYNVGDPTLSVADGGYTQSSTYTVTFPAAATSDPAGEAALVAESKATVNGAEVALEAVANGFSLNLGSITAGTDYVVAIPAGVYGYAGESMNAAINVTLHAPAVLDGTYALYDETNGVFLSRGGSYGTEASADKYGVPFNLTTDATGASRIEFVDWTGVYLTGTTSIFTDQGGSGWKFVATTGGYYLKTADGTNYTAQGNGTYGSYIYGTATEGDATVWTIKTVSERDAIINAYSTNNMNDVITESGVATTAAEFVDYLEANYNAVDATSSVGTASFAGAIGDYWTWTGTNRTQGGQPAYGDHFAEVFQATGTYTQTVSGLAAGIYKVTIQGFERRKDNASTEALYAAGYNCVSSYLDVNGQQVRFTDWAVMSDAPNSPAAGKTDFAKGEGLSTVYVYLDGTEDLVLTIKKPTYLGSNWLLIGDLTLTRYTQTEATMAVDAEAKYGTFVAPFDVTIPGGVSAYKVTGVESDGSTLTLTKVTTTIPANTPVVLNAESGLAATTFKGKAVAGTPTEGLLTGVYADTPALNGSYVLQNNGGKVGFYQVDTEVATPTVGANRAYLTMGGGSAKAFFFGDEATAIAGVEAAEAEDDAPAFNLAGQPVTKDFKGIVIKNGKKFLQK